MPSAAIDVGSNTIRTLIGYIEDKKIHRLFLDRATTRLAEGLKDTGYLKRKNIENSIKVLKGISSTLSKYKVLDIKAVGTAALREAKNSREFIEEVKRETGIEIRIISGQEEARLTLKGALSGLDISEKALIVDIGGGSTEWIIYEPVNPAKTCYGTMPVGVVNLLESYIKNDPPTESELEAIKDDAADKIRKLRDVVSKRNPKTLIGTGGTITTLASIDLSLDRYEPEVVHGHRLPLRRLEEIRDGLIAVPIMIRKAIKGLEPGRADLIIPGIILTIKIVKEFGLGEIIVSDYGLLEGLLIGGKDEEGF